jgi:hypothetical protein
MPARFNEPTDLNATTPLTELHRARLAVVGPRYFGGKGPANLPGADSNGDPMESRTLLFCEERKVVDGERHLFDAWFYMADSGTFFVAGTADPIARIIQCGLQCDDATLRAILGPAMVEAKLLPRGDGGYEEFAQLLALQSGGLHPATTASTTVPKKRPATKAATRKKVTPTNVAKPAPKKTKTTRKSAAKTPAKKTGRTAKKKPAAKQGTKKNAVKKEVRSRS